MNLDTSALLQLQGQNIQKSQALMSDLGAKATVKSPTKTGDDFETMVLSQLLQPMFDGLNGEGLFGGGEGEDAFKSIYIDSIAKQVSQSGGLGISAQVKRELLRLQEGHSS